MSGAARSGSATACHFIASLPDTPHTDHPPHPLMLEYDMSDNALRTQLLKTAAHARGRPRAAARRPGARHRARSRRPSSAIGFAEPARPVPIFRHRRKHGHSGGLRMTNTTRRTIVAGARSGRCLAWRRAPAAQDAGQDRRHLSAERQLGERRQLFQDGHRGRRRRRQQRQRRSRQDHAARQGRRPAGPEAAPRSQLIFADNQGTPAAGQNQALRLITEEKVAALIGAYQSGITLTASAIAERHGIPFLNAESVAANLTERGFKWFFRTTPVAVDFARAYSTFLKEQKAAGQKVDSIAHRPREHRVRQLGRQRHRRPVRQGRPQRHAEDRLLGQLHATCSRRCCSSRRRTPTS